MKAQEELTSSLLPTSPGFEVIRPYSKGGGDIYFSPDSSLRIHPRIGIGIARLIMMLTGAPTIRDVVLFPLLKKKD